MPGSGLEEALREAEGEQRTRTGVTVVSAQQSLFNDPVLSTECVVLAGQEIKVS